MSHGIWFTYGLVFDSIYIFVIYIYGSTGTDCTFDLIYLSEIAA